MDNTYKAPKVTTLGTVSAATLDTIGKTGVSGDVIVIGGQSISAPGSHVI